MTGQAVACKLCQKPTEFVGFRRGKYILKDFEIRRCAGCHFAFVANPCLDLNQIYGQTYYSGDGPDPWIDYETEITSPSTCARQYEWRGIERAVSSCISLTEATRWLDFGCGTGGLVAHCRSHTKCQAFGYEASDVTERLKHLGSSLLDRDDLEMAKGSFDVVTAIEVLEHLPDPMSELRLIRSMLKPGGLFFFTTGNSEPFAKDLLKWSYLIPEIHISLFEPTSLAMALTQAGFRPEFPGFGTGFEDIVRFKILKKLRVAHAAWWERMLPWSVLSRAADSIYKVSAHPRGWAA